jgi:hypothetical protein
VSVRNLVAGLASLALLSCSGGGATNSDVEQCPVGNIGKPCNGGLCVSATCSIGPDGSTRTYPWYSCAACALPMDGCWQAEAGTRCTYAGQAGTCQAIQTGGWLGNDGGSIQYAEPQCWVPPPPETFPAPSPECALAPGGGGTNRGDGLTVVVGIALALFARRRSIRAVG